MKPSRKLLVPTDLSEDSARSLVYSVALATESGAELVILAVGSRFQPWWLMDSDFDPAAGDWGIYSERDRRIEESRNLDSFLDKHLKGSGRIPAVRRKVALGEAADEIVEAAREESADLIVMAAGSPGVLNRLIAGNTAARVAREAPCPVLTVPSRRLQRRTPGRIGTVLCPTGLSDRYRVGVSHAASLARENGAELVLFHAASLPATELACSYEAEAVLGLNGLRQLALDHASREAETMLRDFIGGRFDWELRSLRWRLKVALGGLAPSIVAAAIREEADVIVMAKQESGIAARFFPSVSGTVSREAPCPVLSIRPSEFPSLRYGKRTLLRRRVLQASGA